MPIQDKTLDKIECPQCGASIPVTETLQNQITDHLKKEFETKAFQREKEFSMREKDIKRKEVEIAEAKQDIDKEVQKKLKEETTKIESVAKIKAKEEFSVELRDLREQNEEKEKKLRKAEEAELAIRKKARELEDREKSLSLEVERKISTEKQKIEEETAKRFSEDHRLKDLEKDKQINDLKKLTEELKRKAEQGSQQTQGEVMELELENFLKANFPFDQIEPVPKGFNGADIIQKVHTSTGNLCGIIVWESKQTKSWIENWIEKLKNDQREIKADLAVIVTETLPKEINNFAYKDGVWVTNYASVLGLASVLRDGIVQVARIKTAVAGKDERMEILFGYLTGPQFRQRVEAISEAFKAMREELEDEKRATMRRWAKREKYIDRITGNTSGMYGDLQGLIGSSMQSIPALEEPKENEKSE